MLMLNGTVVTAFDEAITILCISPLECLGLHRIFLTLHVLNLLSLYAIPQNLGAWRGHFP